MRPGIDCRQIMAAAGNAARPLFAGCARIAANLPTKVLLPMSHLGFGGIRRHQVRDTIAILALASLLSGCSEPIRTVPFAGSLTIFVGLLILLVSALQSAFPNRSWVAITSAILGVVLALLSADTLGTKLFRRAHRSTMMAFFLFAPGALLGGILATVLVQFDPRLSVYLFVFSSIVLLAVWQFPIDKYSEKFAAGIGVIAFATWCGSLFAAVLLYERQVTPLLVILLAVIGVGFLAYQAWSAEGWRTKIGTYIVTFILSYETWLFVRGMIATLN
jgi:hypothetical protein